MSVITSKKRLDEIVGLVQRLDGSPPTAVLGCNRCGKACHTGGEDEVQQMRLLLESAGLAVTEVPGLVDAIDEGMCDAKAVAERVVPLGNRQGDLQLLVLSCGAGLKCLRDTLPGLHLVPGLDTLGPGVKDELACLSCGDCRFGEEGCAMLAVSRRQSERLRAAYPVQATELATAFGPSRSRHRSSLRA